MNSIKAIIFDLDGVLVDTKKIHFNSLNKALKKNNINYSISYEDHLKFFDGLPTVEKLNILIKKKLIKKHNFFSIIKYKNIFTIQELKNIGFDKNIYKIFFNLSKKYKLAVATNAIKSTLNNCLKKLRINKFISYKISNDDVKNFKPHPEMYLRCFVEMSIKPQESLIVEDSHFGRLAA